MHLADAPNAGRWCAAMAVSVFITFCAWPGNAGNGTVTLWVVNDGGSATEFVVRDEVCVPPDREACDDAQLKLASGICLKDPASRRCRNARALATGDICRSDVLYDGLVSRGERVQVKACLSAGGYASISVRGRDWNTAWQRYLMLNDGDTVKYP